MPRALCGVSSDGCWKWLLVVDILLAVYYVGKRREGYLVRERRIAVLRCVVVGEAAGARWDKWTRPAR